LKPEESNAGSGTEPAVPHKRRVRYSGKNPRHFALKYKEHNPALYPRDAEKILSSGKTLAGSHRPICLKEILEILDPRPGIIAVDATLGYGGHAQEILGAIMPGGKLLGMDVDPIELPKTENRLRNLGFSSDVFVTRKSNFAGLPRFLAAENLSGADIILADLGISSMQIDNPERGFTFKFEGPLDLRMNPTRGIPASLLLEKITQTELEAILSENSDEPHASIISQSICEAGKSTRFSTTKSLASLIKKSLLSIRKSEDDANAAIRRTFQALRIAVNDEFGALETFLRNLPLCLKPGGCVAILTFHSGEDRRVKKAFALGERDGTYTQISREIIRASPEEVRENPRASSAKLRWARRA
jgi:16S rRNA (cytosine1402-N4)-methyltransferase